MHIPDFVGCSVCSFWHVVFYMKSRDIPIIYHIWDLHSSLFSTSTAYIPSPHYLSHVFLKRTLCGIHVSSFTALNHTTCGTQVIFLK